MVGTTGRRRAASMYDEPPPPLLPPPAQRTSAVCTTVYDRIVIVMRDVDACGQQLACFSQFSFFFLLLSLRCAMDRADFRSRSTKNDLESSHAHRTEPAQTKIDNERLNARRPRLAMDPTGCALRRPVHRICETPSGSLSFDGLERRYKRGGLAAPPAIPGDLAPDE